MSRTLTADRSRLPQPGPPRPFAFPPVEKSTLPNGLRVWTVQHTQVPLVSFVLVIGRGASADPSGQEGLAAITADMLDEGSGERSAIQMHERIALLGAQFDTDMGADAMAVSVSVLSRFADRALEIVGDIVVRPALREADFERVRQLRLHRLKQLRDSPAAVADRSFLRLLYGDDPYGHTPIGNERALASIDVQQVRAFHARTLVPSVSTLIAIGDCDHASIVRMAAETLGGWSGPDDDAALPPMPHSAGSRLAVIPRPNAPQSELRIGQIAAARHTPDYHALGVANAILGGQFVSRINLNLRERRGFTYGARTAFEFRRRPGPFVLQASVQTAATAEAIRESLDEIAGIRGPRPVTAEELSFGIAALTRGYARNFETADQIARAVMQLAVYDLPDDHYAEFVPRVEAITRDEVSRVMTDYLDPAGLTTLVVGDLNTFGPELARAGFAEPLVLSADTF